MSEEQENFEKKFEFTPPAKILVIDDSHLNRSFIVNAFNNGNYEIVTAVDGQEGMEFTPWN